MPAQKEPAEDKSTRKASPDKQKKKKKFPIVGMGASAGGLEAVEQFFKNMPPDSGMAFVLISHLDPSHISIMPELLQKCTTMNVRQAEEGTRVRPNCVYVIPPKNNMAILNGKLELIESTGPSSLRLPIDFFFRSLAQDLEQNAVCIILSGTGTDGTLGLKTIREKGGMVMVQDTESAKYDGMPRSAIATGLADYVLPPEKMPEQLIKYVGHDISKATLKTASVPEEVPSALQKIFVLIRQETGHDFSTYKKNTICRRIERRMKVHQLTNILHYVRYLQSNPLEISILFKDLLIGVTNFFRDVQAFESLKKTILQQLLKDKPDKYTIRAWVPGCSSGEEAYSLAIMLCERITSLDQNFMVQIFGTDIDTNAIDIARTGVYPSSISADMSPARLKQFFSKEGATYRIKKEIRELLVFAPHNVIKDPPFTKLDLISCRNLLIYLNAESQKKLLPIFHYSLKPNGFLFLGTSESIGKFTDLFGTVDKKWKIFKCKKSFAQAPAITDFPIGSGSREVTKAQLKPYIHNYQELSISQLVEKKLLESYAPSSVIINERGDILFIHGRTGKYLEPAAGEASLNILHMARQGLKAELVTALRKVYAKKQDFVCPGLRVKTNGDEQKVNLIVKPLLEPESVQGLAMVIFEDIASAKEEKPTTTKKVSTKKEAGLIAELERELKHTRENLQTTIEELETSNEELKSTNEELQSTNEELQSTNEELETSKEELQSLNEELITVNAELQGRIDELTRANDDMKNLLDSTDIATIFLDNQLRVRRFTPKATEIISLIPSDSGRPISHIVSNLEYTNLIDDAKEVIKSLIGKKIEVKTKTGQYYSMQITPYRTLTNVIDGVVITFQDTTELKQAEEKLENAYRMVEEQVRQQTKELYTANEQLKQEISKRKEADRDLSRLATVVKDSNDAITLQDRQGNILAWNFGAEQMYGYSEAEALKMNISDIVPEESRHETSDMIKKIFEGETIASFKTKRLTKDGRIIDVWLTVTIIKDEVGNPQTVATTERDLGKLNEKN